MVTDIDLWKEVKFIEVSRMFCKILFFVLNECVNIMVN